MDFLKKQNVYKYVVLLLFAFQQITLAQDTTSVHIYDSPSNVETNTEYDSETETYEETEQVGDGIILSPSILYDFDEYKEHRKQQMIKSYWRTLSGASTGEDKKTGINLTNVIPQYKLDKEKIGQIFGTDGIDIKLQGSVELDFQLKNTFRDNQTIPVNRRTTTTFKMDNDIQVSADGSIGEKLNLNLDHFTQSLFNRRNLVDLKYEGEEDEIIKLVQLGNINMPLPGTLITGSQDLFGVKAQLQFGRTTITTVFSEQRSQGNTFQVENGGQKNNFEFEAVKYDVNRHFFIAPYFYNNYDRALKDMPFVDSQVDITRIEVWITNTRTSIEDVRDVFALTHIGDNINDIDPGENVTGDPTAPEIPINSNNNLNPVDLVAANPEFRDYKTLSSAITAQNFIVSKDYEKLEKARKLAPNEYTFNPKLGFISLNQTLQNGAVLAVAFQYTYRGEVYQVGEFADQLQSPSTLMLKLLRPTITDPEHPTWKLMMKNVYSLGAYQVNKEDFILNILYKQPESGSKLRYIPEPEVDNKQLIDLLNLDSLNSNGNAGRDGYFDFIDNPILTIDPAKGKVYLPAVEPFGTFIRDRLIQYGVHPDTAENYMFPELYSMTQNDAEQRPENNRYILKGSYKSQYGSEISLNAYNLQQGSVTLKQGSEKLVEGIDFIVDYSLGRVTIINESKLNAGTPISISVESQNAFAQTKRFMGLRVDHEVNKKLILGGTILNLKETPITNKINYGEEPINNTIWGIDGTYQDESPFLTNLADKIPFVETEAKSNVFANMEFAQFLPGHPNIINIDEGGTSYIDDFENGQTEISILYPNNWKLASVPFDPDGVFPESEMLNELHSGFNRAELSWFVIRDEFYSSVAPSHIVDNKDILDDPYQRDIPLTEIFENKDIAPNQIDRVRPLNLVFDPNQPGPYNYDVENTSVSAGLNPDGTLKDPASRWAGITQRITSPDWEASNIEYIEFWMMDPYITNTDHTGGDLFLNIGSISEDILLDTRKSFENGLPTPNNPSTVDTTSWGLVSNSQILVRSFDNTDGAIQDVGYDGLDDSQEFKFAPPTGSINESYMTRLENEFGNTSAAYQNRFNDPSNDNYEHFLSEEHDNNKANILERYAKFNRSQNNTFNNFLGNGTTLPNMEDIDADNTLNENQSYYQYRIDLRKENLNVENNKYITQVLENKGPDQNTNWYLFRIPIRDIDKEAFGGINNFKSIRFMRMYLRGFTEPVVLRFATLSMVRGNWRQYANDLNPSNGSFEIASVNIEENGLKEPIPYVLPPGIQRERIQGASNSTIQNEQSLSLKVCGLEEGKEQIAYKNLPLNVNNYERLKMFVHAEAVNAEDINDGEVSLFIRMGTDYTENYYEYEIPLEMTPWGETEPRNIWPLNNEVDINFQHLIDLKLKRNKDIVSTSGTADPVTYSDRYVGASGGKNIYVKGNPNIGDARSVMIGIRNTSTSGDKCAEIWVNELRLVGFQNESSIAFRGQFRTNLADFADLNVSGSYLEAGFGALDQSLSLRRQENLRDFSINTTVNAGKFFPDKWGVNLPIYYGITDIKSTPRFNPLDQDVKYEDALANASTSEERQQIEDRSITQSHYKSFNITNVGINPKANSKKRFYSPSNIKVSYSRTELEESSPEIERNIERSEQGRIIYGFNSTAKPVMPFKKVKFLAKSKILRPIKEFNFYLFPKSITYNYFVERDFKENLIRPIIYLGEDTPGGVFDPIYSQSLKMNSTFGIKFDLTKSLKLNLQGTSNGIYKDEVQTKITSNRVLWDEILSMGTTQNYHQSFDASYKLPLKYIPYTKWMDLNLNYNASYDWIGASTIKEDRNLGHIIQNQSEIELRGKLDFKKVYKEIPVVKKVYGGRSKKKKSKREARLKKRFDKKTKKLKKKVTGLDEEIKELNESLADSVVTDSLKLNNAIESSTVEKETVEGEMEELDKAYKDKKKKLKDKAKKKKEKERKKKNKVSKPVETLIRLATAIQKVDGSYRKSEGTVLPGFRYQVTPFGHAEGSGFSVPGLGYVFGQQSNFGPNNMNLREYASAQDWLVNNQDLNDQYSKQYQEQITVKALVEPIKRFRINMDASRKETVDLTEYYRSTGQFDAEGKPIFSTQNTNETGNFNVTILTLNTAFKNQDEVFQTFLDNRQIMARRVADARAAEYGQAPLPDDPDGFPVGFNGNSQEVLIPAFLAAYTGKSATTQSLNKFTDIPLPNWKITYDGLRYISWLKKKVKRISLTSAYSSVYTIGNFSRNLLFDESVAVTPGLTDNIDLNGNFIPKYQINQVTISEQFNPLVKVDVTLKNNMSFNTAFKRSRNLTLNIDNSQLLQEDANSYVVGMGYRMNDVKIFKNELGKSKVPRTLEFNLDINYNFKKSIVRNIYDEGQQVNSGNEQFGVSFSANYTINELLNCSVYFDRNSSESFILSSFPIRESIFGIKIKYTLTQ